MYCALQSSAMKRVRRLHSTKREFASVEQFVELRAQLLIYGATPPPVITHRLPASRVQINMARIARYLQIWAFVLWTCDQTTGVCQRSSFIDIGWDPSRARISDGLDEWIGKRIKLLLES